MAEHRSISGLTARLTSLAFLLAAFVPAGADAEISVLTGGGALLHLGVSDGPTAPLSLQSTAEALLYYQVGGMWLPGDQQDVVRDLLRGRSEATALASHLQRLLLAAGNGLQEPDQALYDAMEAAHASAATIAFAIETVMVSGDITKIVTDLASAPKVASWQVEVMPARFLIDPAVATIHSGEPTARFKVRAVGDPPSGNYRFRWSTSGTHGVVYDFMGSEDLVIDTESPEVMYIPNDLSNIKAGDVDSILLEVFLVDDGVDEIPADARPIGKGQAEVRGQGQEDLCYIECREDGLCYHICP